MNVDTFDFEGLTCRTYAPEGALHVAYLLYPMDMPAEWASSASARYGTDIVVVTGMDWDNDLTPWRAPGVPRGCPDFRGGAREFLDRLVRLTSAAEERLRLTDNVDRTLVGVSLSGLFALWQWALSDMFINIASLSGSFWYKDFMDWFGRQNFSLKRGRAYFLLGDREGDTRVRAFAPVVRNTRAIADSLRRQGVDCNFDLVPGNHYDHPIERLDLAMADIFSKPRRGGEQTDSREAEP